MKRMIMGAVAAGGLLGGMAAMPAVENVAVATSATTRQIAVTYDLTGANAIVTCDVLTNGVSIGAGNLQGLQGDVNRLVAAGAGHALYWRPHRDWSAGGVLGDGANVTVKLTAWSEVNPPDYMVADLAASKDIRYYPSAEAIPGGVGDTLYKTRKMVFRRIPAAGCSFVMGSPGAERGRGLGASASNWYVNTTETQHLVGFTNDFWLAIYEVTQGQYRTLQNAATAGGYFTAGDEADLRPRDTLGRYHLTGDYDGPRLNNRYYSNNGYLIANFKTKTGLANVTLPTDAEWEFACRAGTCAAYHWGGEMTTNAAGENVSLELGDYAWYDANAGGTTHPVGLKKPNPWGLYDMYGNVSETVLDRLKDSDVKYATDEIDPLLDKAAAGEYSGVNANGASNARGGSWWEPAAACRSAARAGASAKWGFNGVANDGHHLGARLAVRID